MAIVAGDWTVERSTGAIRYIGDDHGGAAPSYATVIQFHRWLQGLADDAVATGDDELDITNTDPSRRSTDNIITLINGYNITATEAEHLYDGSIIQGTVGVDQKIWDGIVNFGNGSVVIQLMQNGAVLADDWWNYNVSGTHTGAANASVLTDSGATWTTNQWAGYTIVNTTDGSKATIISNTSNTITATLAGGIDNDWDNGDVYKIAQGLNANAAAGISHRFMILVHDYAGSGGDIDGRRLLGTCRRYGNVYSEFSINGTSRGNNVLALSDSSDLNNSTAVATVAGWNTIDNTTEGYKGLDVNNDTVMEYYYSEWNRASYTINQFYERMKFLTKDGLDTEASCLDTGSDFTVDNATITGAAQSFVTTANPRMVMQAVVNLKKSGTPTGNMTAKIYTHSGVYGTSSTPNTLVGSASSGVDASTLTGSYTPVTFTFPTPVPLSASTNYCLVIEHPDGSAGSYVQIQGLASSGTHGGNRSHNTGGWTAVAGDDLNFRLLTTAEVYGLPGILMRGITHQVAISSGSGTWAGAERITWGSGATAGVGQLLAIDNTAGASATTLWMQLLSGVVPSSVTITGATSSATAVVGASPNTERTVSKPFCGASTGSAIIGAYGFGIEVLDLAATDKVTSLANVVITPPNYVTNTVGGLVSGEDRVLVGPWDGVTYDTNGDPAITKDQLSLNGNLTTANVASIVVNEAIPLDTPAAGFIRVTDDDGFERRIKYTSWATSTFTVDTVWHAANDTQNDFDGVQGSGTYQATSGNNVYIAYIDVLASASTATFTSVQTGTRQLVVLVRDGGTAGDGFGIKQFISAWSQTSSPQTITAIRTSDV